MRKSYNCEVILIFVQIVLRNSYDPDSRSFWIRIRIEVFAGSGSRFEFDEYGSETLDMSAEILRFHDIILYVDQNPKIFL